MGVNLTEKYNYKDYDEDVNKVFLFSEWDNYKYFSLRSDVYSGVKQSVALHLFDIINNNKGLNVDIFTKHSISNLKLLLEEVFKNQGYWDINKRYNTYFKEYNINNNTIGLFDKDSALDVNKRNISVILDADLFTKDELNDILVRTSDKMIIINSGGNEEAYAFIEEKNRCVILQSSYNTNTWLSEQDKKKIHDSIVENPIKWGYINTLKQWQ